MQKGGNKKFGFMRFFFKYHTYPHIIFIQFSFTAPHLSAVIIFMAEVGQPLPKFGEWDVNDPASAEGFTVIFNKARNEKKTGGTADSPPKTDSTQGKPGAASIGKPQSKKWFCFKA